ncbi:MAG: hypothetical protein IJQ44_08205 [Bacteroidaceae bacterium]|nr:hypothetical protein [Bacteroidaceae bacterium]
MKKNLFEVAAIWLNGEKKDFQEGIAILKEAGFKPGVVSKLERDGVGGPAAAERLEFQIREFMKAYGFDSNVPDTDPELHVFDGQESPADIPEEKQLGIMATAEKIEAEEMTVEDVNAERVIHEYAAAYRQREQAMRLMAEVGEQNDEESMAKRKQFSDKIDECTALMERLYQLFERYQSGAEISDEDVEKTIKGSSSTSPEHSAAMDSGAAHTSEATATVPAASAACGIDLEGKSREELVLLKKNATSRITRAKCKLEYQAETKGETPNPMPEGPKREKLLAKIANEEKLIEAIDMAIAKFG